MLKIGEVFSESWNLFKSNLVAFSMIYLLGNSALIFSKILEIGFYRNPQSVAINLYFPVFITIVIVGILLYFFFAMVLILAIDYKRRGKAFQLKELIQESKVYFWKYLGYSILYALMIIVGMVLLVIPAIYLGTLNCFYGIAIILDQSKEPFKASKQLVSSHFWKVLFVGTIILVVGLILDRLTQTLFPMGDTIYLLFDTLQGLVVGIFATIVMVVMYHKLKFLQTESPPPTTP